MYVGPHKHSGTSWVGTLGKCCFFSKVIDLVCLKLAFQEVEPKKRSESCRSCRSCAICLQGMSLRYSRKG